MELTYPDFEGLLFKGLNSLVHQQNYRNLFYKLIALPFPRTDLHSYGNMDVMFYLESLCPNWCNGFHGWLSANFLYLLTCCERRQR